MKQKIILILVAVALTLLVRITLLTEDCNLLIMCVVFAIILCFLLGASYVYKRIAAK